MDGQPAFPCAVRDASRGTKISTSEKNNPFAVLCSRENYSKIIPQIVAAYYSVQNQPELWLKSTLFFAVANILHILLFIYFWTQTNKFCEKNTVFPCMKYDYCNTLLSATEIAKDSAQKML